MTSSLSLTLTHPNQGCKTDGDRGERLPLFFPSIYDTISPISLISHGGEKMAITSIRRDWNGEVSIVRMITTNTLAEVGTAGYLTEQIENLASINSGEWTWQTDDMVLVSASDGVPTFFTVSTDLTSLELYSTAGNGGVSLPVVSGNFAVFDGTLGALEDAGYAPSDATKTSVVMAGSAVQVGYIAHFIDTAGTVDDTAEDVINAGNIQAGLSGTAGALISYPATAANGSLQLAASNAGANFNMIITNSTLGQDSTVAIADPGNANARLLLAATATPFVSGNFPEASGTGGLMVDSGVSASDLVYRYQIIAGTTADIGGAGVGPISVAVAGVATTSAVVATVESSSNPVSVVAATATVTGFDITFSADPGAACLVNYFIYNSAPLI